MVDMAEDVWIFCEAGRSRPRRFSATKSKIQRVQRKSSVLRPLSQSHSIALFTHSIRLFRRSELTHSEQYDPHI
jgi:hypothetical protein